MISPAAFTRFRLSLLKIFNHMTKAYRYLLIFAVSCLAFCSCRNAATDEYYERPDWLEKPIYGILEEDGSFGMFLQCIDRTAYAKVLQGAGLYTVFAPTDEAFSAWLSAKGYKSVDDIPLQEVKDLIAYSVVYSKWPSDKFAYSFVKKVYEVGSFKRQTACYSLPYRDSEFGGKWVVDETKNGGISYSQSDYVLNLTQQNYKYLPIFTQEFFDSYSPALSAVDYQTFFPNSSFSGLAVQSGTASRKDIYAENGLIHVVTTLNEPMDNIETVLKKPEYQGYYNLLTAKDETGDYRFRTYQNIEEINFKLLETYQTIMPDSFTELYVKEYPTDLGFSPVLEHIFDSDGNDVTERSGNTVFVPNNDTLENYINNRLCRYYNREDLPSEILLTLINTHMAPGLVWPSVYSNSFNSTGEFLNGLGQSGDQFADAGVLGQELASNGMVYHIDHVIKSRYFETVFSDIYLNPDNRLLKLGMSASTSESLMKSPLNGYVSERWTVLNLKDSLLIDDGIGYDDINADIIHADLESADADVRLQRLIGLHTFPGLKNDELDSEIKDFTATPLGASVYGGWAYLVTNSGDMIRYKDGKLQASGNIMDNTFVTVTKVDNVFNNGQVFNIDGLLQYSPVKTSDSYQYTDIPLLDYLDLAAKDNNNVSSFVKYVRACLLNADGGLDGIKSGQFYTILMPNNTAINNAIKGGYLPEIDKITVEVNGDSDPEGAAAKAAALAKGIQFVNSHILVGQVFADDGYPFIYPVNDMSPLEAVVQTLHKVTEEKYDLTSKATQIRVFKGKNNVLSFEPLDITRGNEILIDGRVGTSTSLTAISGVNRGVSYKGATDNFRSNRIASRAVLHEVSNFIHYDVK